MKAIISLHLINPAKGKQQILDDKVGENQNQDLQNPSGDTQGTGTGETGAQGVDL